MYIPAANRCTRYRDSIPVNCSHHAGDASRSCPVGSYIDKQCNIREAVYSDFDRSSCKACPKRWCQPGTFASACRLCRMRDGRADTASSAGQKLKPCTGTSGTDDSICVPCPDLPSGRYVSFALSFFRGMRAATHPMQRAGAAGENTFRPSARAQSVLCSRPTAACTTAAARGMGPRTKVSATATPTFRAASSASMAWSGNRRYATRGKAPSGNARRAKFPALGTM